MLPKRREEKLDTKASYVGGRGYADLDLVLHHPIDLKIKALFAGHKERLVSLNISNDSFVKSFKLTQEEFQILLTEFSNYKKYKIFHLETLDPAGIYNLRYIPFTNCVLFFVESSYSILWSYLVLKNQYKDLLYDASILLEAGQELKICALTNSHEKQIGTQIDLLGKVFNYLMRLQRRYDHIF